MSELLPCPFCGGFAAIKQVSKLCLKVYCVMCGVGKKQCVLKYSLEWLQETMIKKWNERVEY